MIRFRFPNKSPRVVVSLNETDFIHSSEGEGPHDHCEVLKAAVEKPTSQVHRWLKQTELWAEEAFGLRCLHSSSLIRSRVNSNATSIVEAVMAFLGQLRHDKLISQDDFNMFLGDAHSVRQQNGVESSARARIDWAANVVESLLELNPSIGAQYPFKASGLER